MRTHEQVDKLLDLAGVVRGLSWTRPTKDNSFYDVILDKAISDMRSKDVTVRRNSTRTVGAYSEHFSRRHDVLAVLRERCSDPDAQVAHNAKSIVAYGPPEGSGLWWLAEFALLVREMLQRFAVVPEPALAAANAAGRCVDKEFVREGVRIRMRVNESGGDCRVSLSAYEGVPVGAVLRIAMGSGDGRIVREVRLHGFRGVLVGECVIRAHDIEAFSGRMPSGSDIPLEIEFDGSLGPG